MHDLCRQICREDYKCDMKNIRNSVKECSGLNACVLPPPALIPNVMACEDRAMKVGPWSDGISPFIKRDTRELVPL